MSGHEWAVLVGNMIVAGIGGGALGLALALRDRVHQLEKDTADLLAFVLSLVRRLPRDCSSLPDDLTDSERQMWERFADYYREDRYR